MNQRKDYRKMTPSGKKQDRGPKKRPSQKSYASKQPSEKWKTSQIVTLTLLIILIIFLGALVFLLFQPQKIQLWQQNFVRLNPEGSDTPEVKRLLPETEPELTISEVPEEKSPEPPKEEAPEKGTVPSRTREARLFYVKVNTEGQITLKGISRSVQYSSSPLTETINSLLGGPSSDEINKGSLTLIPEGTRLLSARVEGNTAFLNFNEAFRFNSLGREGYLAQLKQIVYTATEFSNIDYVQILIEGDIKEYLGGEGMFIGDPLSRESFQSLP